MVVVQQEDDHHRYMEEVRLVSSQMPMKITVVTMRAPVAALKIAFKRRLRKCSRMWQRMRPQHRLPLDV